MSVSLKDGVNVQGVAPETWYAVGVARMLMRTLFNQELTVTSMNDGQHMDGSLHYKGRAADFRTRDLTIEQRKIFHDSLAGILDRDGFDCVQETHIINGNNVVHEHIEFDPKQGESFTRIVA